MQVFATRSKRVLEIVLHGSCALCDFYKVSIFFFAFEGCFFFPPKEGANQAVPKALMDMVKKISNPSTAFGYFYSKS